MFWLQTTSFAFKLILVFSIKDYDWVPYFFKNYFPSQIAKFKGPTWSPPGSCRPQMGPMLAPWTLLSGIPMFPFPSCSSSPLYFNHKNFQACCQPTRSHVWKLHVNLYWFWYECFFVIPGPEFLLQWIAFDHYHGTSNVMHYVWHSAG